ncbi:MAG: two-component system histidine kinase PnpS [Bacillaceae bacterium]
MNSFRSRLLLTLTTLLLVVLITLGFIIGNLINNVYIGTFHERITRDMNFLSSEIKNNNLKSEPFLNRIDSEMKTKFHLDGLLVGTDGHVYVETNKQLLTNLQNWKDQFQLDNLKLKTAKDVKIKHLYGQTYLYGMNVKDAFNVEAYLFVQLEVEELDKVKKQIWIILSVGFATALFVITWLGKRITSKYTKPIESITKVATQLAKGNYRARSYEEFNDETGMLSQAINTLARNLQESMVIQEMQQDRLETLIENIGSGILLIDKRGFINLVNRTYRQTFGIRKKDIMYHLYYEVIPYPEIVELIGEIFLTEVNIRKQLVVPIGIERKHFEIYGAPIIGINHEWKGIVVVFHDITELKRLEQMRKDFLANVSHELRTPITSIKGFAETLIDGAGENKEIREQFLSIIYNESDRMQMLIQELLDLSKMEQANFKLDLSIVNVSEILENVAVTLENKAVSKGINLSSSIEKDVYIYGDGQRLKQIFVNLIANGINYTPEGGQLVVNLKQQEKDVVVTIKDTGIGIPAEEIPRIFERFYRVDKARSRDSGGTGLGLAIVKHLVEAHKGSIAVNSEIGKGTTFIITFKGEE